MDITRMKSLLRVLDGVDISEVGILVSEDGKENKIRGITQDKSMLVYDSVDAFMDTTMGIINVKNLNNRLALFDEEKMGVEVSTKSGKNGEYVTEVRIKEGRRRSRVITTDPTQMAIPTQYPETEVVFTASVDKEYVAYLNKIRQSITATSAVKEMTVKLELNENSDGILKLTIDGDYDDFQDEVNGDVVEEYKGESFSAQWKTHSFMKALRLAATVNEEDSIDFQVTDIGILQVGIGGFTVSIAPVNVSSSREAGREE